MKTLKYFTNNTFKTSKTKKYFKVFNPNTGKQIAQMPKMLAPEIDQVLENAHKAYLTWSRMPILKRVQILYKVRELVVKHADELTYQVCEEQGKNWAEAAGDIAKVKEGTEVACSMPNIMMGESLMDASRGYDTVTYRESLGVFVGIVPFNFPGMIPFGWMTPICVACGNTIVLKINGATPLTCMKMAQIYKEAGMPDGVVNLVCCENEGVQQLIKSDYVKGVTFVGSTRVGRIIYEMAAKHGKRVQCLCEAKNHALVMNDAQVERTAAGIINASFGCAGQRCMALPVVVAQSRIADKLVATIKKLASQLKVGPGYDKTVKLGPVYSAEHKKRVIDWINVGLKEGAKLVLDGRKTKVKGYEKGFYVGPTILDHVTPKMTVGQREIFGPVLCIKRVKTFKEGLALMNASPFANGSVIYTQSGYFAREFARNTDGGQVGINVGIPVPVGVFSFTGHKHSFFGDLHVLGKDSYRFFTETKTVTQHWFDEEEGKSVNVSTWDGTI